MLRRGHLPQFRLYRVAQGFVRGQSFYHTGLGIGFAVPAGFALDNTQAAVLASGTDGTALRFDSATLNAGETLTAYLNSGWVNGLQASSIRTLTVSGLPDGTLIHGTGRVRDVTGAGARAGVTIAVN